MPQNSDVQELELLVSGLSDLRASFVAFDMSAPKVSQAIVTVEPKSEARGFGQARCLLWVQRNRRVRFTPRKRTCSYTSMRSINVGSSPAAFELFTLRDTGYIRSDL